MIIGQIIETTNGVSTGPYAGAGAMLLFYTENDAIEWARLTSVNAPTPEGNTFTTTMVVNTDTGVRRWWYDGTEYTG